MGAQFRRGKKSGSGNLAAVFRIGGNFGVGELTMRARPVLLRKAVGRLSAKAATPQSHGCLTGLVETVDLPMGTIRLLTSFLRR